MSAAGRALLGKDDIESLLTDLGRQCASRGINVEMFLVGGAAMALAYSRKRVTRDLDAVFEPKTAVYAVAQRMADERGLPRDWLNDAVKGVLPDGPDTGEQVTYSADGIEVMIASPEYLFAMKAASARQEADTADLLILAELLAVRTAEQAFELVERFYEASRLSAKSQFFLQAAFAHAEAGP